MISFLWECICYYFKCNLDVEYAEDGFEDNKN